MTKDLENLINLIFMSSASSVLLSGNSISQPEKIALLVAQSFLCKDILYAHRNIPAGSVISGTEAGNGFY